MGERFAAAAVAMQVVHDKSLNLEKHRQFVDQAAAQGVRLLVFPEASLQGFLFHLDHHFDPQESVYHWENAEPVPGPSTEIIAEWALKRDMHIIFGVFERGDHLDTPVLHNSSVLVGPKGYIGTFRKVHQPSEELRYYQPGREWSVFDTPLGPIGMLICYDQCFPEAARELTLRGADILVIPNAWPKSDRASDDRYDFYGRARAAENCRWVLQSNQVSRSDQGDFEYLGCSRIIEPTGTVAAYTPTGQEGLAVAEINPTKLDPTRARSGWYLQQRVPATYTTIGDSVSHQHLR
jgi:predicted amidohydrolase